MSFSEYPKKMSHPNHSPAVWKKLEGKGVGLFAPDTICTSAERFPEVTVSTLDQEKQYAARGYRPNNMANSEEYERAILEMPSVAGYGFQAYPKWKYHAFEIPVIVNSASEESDLGDDWSDSPVMATEDDLVDDDQEPETVEAEAAPATKAPVAKKKAPAKPAAKVDKRSKEYRAAHANA